MRRWTTLLMAIGCGPRGADPPRALEGTYEGRTVDGTAAVLTFTGDAHAFRGVGAIGDDPIVVSGVNGWCGTGAVVRANAGEALADLSLSADGEQLWIAARGGEPLALAKGESKPLPPPGPYSGTFRGTVGRLSADATLVQHGDLVGGVGQIGSRAVGISGRVVGDHAELHATWHDGSQQHVQGTLAADGSLTLEGLGSPVTLARRGAP